MRLNLTEKQGSMDAFWRSKATHHTIQQRMHSIATPCNICNHLNTMTHRGAVSQQAMFRSQQVAEQLIEAGNHDEFAGDIDAAWRKYLDATEIAPSYAKAWLNLGIVSALKLRYNEALQAYDQVLRLEPENWAALYNRGLVLADTGDAHGAESALRAAVARNPAFADASVALASALERQGRNRDAVEALSFAAIKHPTHRGCLLNLGLLLRKIGELDQAETTLRSAFANDPTHGAALHALASVLRETGRPSEACEMLQAIDPTDPTYWEAMSSLAFTRLFMDDVDPEDVSQAHREIGALFEQDSRADRSTRIHLEAPAREQGGTLRIGYVSGDLCRHPIAAFVLPVLERHDRQSFEITCYSSAEIRDDVTARLHAASDTWRDIGRIDDSHAAAMIRDDGIDILVDLSGHTAKGRMALFARKPAPVQATWLGYLGTTGIRAIDYRICDRHTEDGGRFASRHTERLAILPNSQWCYRPFSSAPHVTRPPQSNNGYVTLGSFNQFAKLSYTTRALWARIMTQLPASRLLVVGVPDGRSQADMLASMRSLGVSADRVDVVGRVSVDEYFQLYNKVDIALDPTPYAGGTTTCDALWMSVPVVTLAGCASHSRSGVSLLTNVGLAELVATTSDHYVALAVALARDIDRLSALRRELRGMLFHSPIMEETRFVRGLESTYRWMWAEYCTPSRRSP